MVFPLWKYLKHPVHRWRSWGCNFRTVCFPFVTHHDRGPFGDLSSFGSLILVGFWACGPALPTGRALIVVTISLCVVTFGCVGKGQLANSTGPQENACAFQAIAFLFYPPTPNTNEKNLRGWLLTRLWFSLVRFWRPITELMNIRIVDGLLRMKQDHCQSAEKSVLIRSITFKYIFNI